jgi:hypothetical protein
MFSSVRAQSDPMPLRRVETCECAAAARAHQFVCYDRHVLQGRNGVMSQDVLARPWPGRAAVDDARFQCRMVNETVDATCGSNMALVFDSC